jgi:hypothetical protein
VRAARGRPDGLMQVLGGHSCDMMASFVCAAPKETAQRGGAWGRLTEPPAEGGVDSNREPLALDTAKRRRIQAARRRIVPCPN